MSNNPSRSFSQKQPEGVARTFPTYAQLLDEYIAVRGAVRIAQARLDATEAVVEAARAWKKAKDGADPAVMDYAESVLEDAVVFVDGLARSGEQT